jgi:dUTP pyrophosphatase
MNVKVKKLHRRAQTPQQAHSTDAGFDLYCIEDMKIPPGQKGFAKTGIAMAIPNGYAGLIWPKSGLALNHGIDVLAGVIDSGYRGEIVVILQNHGDTDFTLSAKSQVAQMLFQKVESPSISEVDDLDETPRGVFGFGSTDGHKKKK